MFKRMPVRHLLSGLLMLALLSPPLRPQPEPRLSCGLRFIDRDMNTRVAPPAGFQLHKSATADFEVTYTGFTAEARTAFQFAVDIWAFLITSAVPIKVDAHWVDTLGTTVLGASQPTSFFRSSGPLIANTWYPVALAEKLSGNNLNNSDPDIFAIFNQNFSNWYFGTDGNPPPGKIDFVTVVLHELGHGLGLVGSMTVSGGSGSWGAGTSFPFIFDRFPENNAGQVLISNAFLNPSVELLNQLTGNNLFFDGEEARAENAGNRPKLYAPSTWQEGSSYAHLDESVYPAGDQNSLMTPSLGASEAIHNPGRITAGIFRDMGWDMISTGSGAIPVLSIFQNPALNGYLHLAINVLNFTGSSVSLTANNLNVPVNPNGENGWYGSYQMTAPGMVALKLTAGDATTVREFTVASLRRAGSVGTSFDQFMSIYFPPGSYEGGDTYLAIFDDGAPGSGYRIGPDGTVLQRPATVVFHHAAPGQAIYRRDGEQWTALPTRTDSDGLSAETSRLGAFRLGPAPALIATSALLGNYPNPFNPSTRIRFRVGTDDPAQPAMLQVFNLRGQLQAELLNRSLPAGEHEVTWDGRDRNGNPAASGMYFYQFRIGGRTFSGKMILVR